MNNDGLVLRVPPVENLLEQIRYFPWTSILYVAVVAPKPRWPALVRAGWWRRL